jgi:single-strand DNA-binding protein
VRVVGRLKQERWTGPDGKAQAKILIVAEHVEFRPELTPAVPRQTEPIEAELALVTCL